MMHKSSRPCAEARVDGVTEIAFADAKIIIDPDRGT